MRKHNLKNFGSKITAKVERNPLTSDQVSSQVKQSNDQNISQTNLRLQGYNHVKKFHPNC